jgi:hypothetical protein
LTSSPRASRLRLWLAPPFTALLFLIHPFVALTKPAAVFQDPGIGWHVVTGRYILATGTIPHEDIFSFTAAGRPWISYFWLFQAGAAALEKIGGLPLFAAACVVVYALLPVLVFRRALRMGASLVPALAMAILAYLVLASHALARPHIFTYVFFALALEWLADVQDGRRGIPALAMLPLLFVFWCNLHSGFVAGLTLIGLFAGIAAVRGVLLGMREDRRLALVFAGALAVAAVATLVNPNGPQLHAQIFEQLGQAALRYQEEFQSPDFQPSHVSIFAFEVMMLLTIGVVAFTGRRLAWIEIVLLVFFMHEGLESIRHMNLFAIVAAPILARELSVPFAERFPRFATRSARIVGEQAALRAPLLYFPALAALFMALAGTGVLPFPSTLDGIQLTRGAAAHIAAHPEQFTRAFNTDDLGGPLIYRFWPELHVFVDDRTFLYGDDFLLKQYFVVLYGKKQWHDVLERFGLTSAIVNVDTVCATLFRTLPDWRVVYEDEKNAIFVRTGAR